MDEGATVPAAGMGGIVKASLESPLERLYPNRCFDCLAPCPHHKVLCPACEALYDAQRRSPRDS